MAIIYTGGYMLTEMIEIGCGKLFRWVFYAYSTTIEPISENFWLNKGTFYVMTQAACIHNAVNWHIVSIHNAVNWHIVSIHNAVNWHVVSKSFRSTCKFPVHYFIITPLIMAKIKLPTGNISIVGYFNEIFIPWKNVDACELKERQICPSLDDTLWIAYLTFFFC